VLGSDQQCAAGPAAECGFAGVWSGGGSGAEELKELHLSSYFFDRAQQVTARPRVAAQHTPSSGFG
jgi:hypothetical protein